MAPAFAGVGTVREAVVFDDADCCIHIDASASIGRHRVAGLDENEASRDDLRGSPPRLLPILQSAMTR